MLTVDLVGVNTKLAGIAGFDIEDISQRDLAEDLGTFPDHRPDHAVEADLGIGEEGIQQMIREFDWCFGFLLFGIEKIVDQVYHVIHSLFGGILFFKRLVEIRKRYYIFRKWRRIAKLKKIRILKASTKLINCCLKK